MSTIASPRDSPLPRRMPSSQNASTTPTSSSRPSLEMPRSAASSPNPNAHGASPAPVPAAAAKRNNRAALREYYKLKAGAGGVPGSPGGGGTPVVEVTDPLGDPGGGPYYSEVAASEMDAAGFDAEAYVARALEGAGLVDLLRLYAGVLRDMRTLDAEKKSLVYDNYSRLIAATETIRKMRATMDPLTPVASTLDPAVARIYAQAAAIREALREVVPAPDGAAARRARTRRLAAEVLAAPERIRQLVLEGKEEEARREWEMPRRLLEVWRERGLGGDDVAACLEEGEAALRGQAEFLPDT